MVCSEPERLPCLRGILRCTEKVCQPHSLLRLPLKEGFFYSSPSRSSFLNEPIYSFILIWSPQCLPVIDPLYTFESLFCSSPPYLCSKVFDFHSDISYLRVDQKSSEKSPPSSILQGWRHSSLAECSPTCVYDPGINSFQWFLSPPYPHSFLNIFRCLLWFFHRCLSLIFWCEHNVIFAIPFRMC